MRKLPTESDESEESEEVTLDEDTSETVTLTPERYAEMGAEEQFILAISENGYGKRSSSYEYRIAGRGGKGIIAMRMSARNGNLIAAFPVEENYQIMLVTNNGTLIRCPIDGVRIAGRTTQGVTIFKTEETAKVVSVACLNDANGDDEEDEEGESEEGGEGIEPSGDSPEAIESAEDTTQDTAETTQAEETQE